MSDWFEVDRQGLAQILERRGKSFAVLELIQNAWDEDVSRVEVALEPIPRRPAAKLTVIDDSPEGFEDLSHAFTLFAPSKKKADAEKRGRFNLGEKLVLALCEEGTIASTKGTVSFTPDGRVHHRSGTDEGTEITLTLKNFTRDDVEETTKLVRSLIPPEDIETIYNGETLPVRKPVHAFTATLPTEISDDEGYLRPTARKTSVRLFEPQPGETPMLYEMGIPVVETEDRWHYDIAQKVPLNTDRDNVRPSYLRKLRTLVMNETWEWVDEEDANSTWGREALADPDISDDAVKTLVRKRFGNKAVVYDPSDQEANNLAVSRGYTVVHGSQMSSKEWDQVKRAGSLKPAGRVTPSNSHIQSDPEGQPPKTDLSEAEKSIVWYASRLGARLLERRVSVQIFTMPLSAGWQAAYGNGSLSLNITRISKRRFENPNQHWWDALLIHEFAHEFASNHLDHSFHDAMGELGAKLRDVEFKIGDEDA